MSVRIAINGFGRIGRLAFRQLMNMEGAEIVAINDLTDNDTLAHLLRYDSVHGKFDRDVQVTDQGFVVAGKNIAVFTERNPEALPWGSLNVDVVMECTGIFRDEAGAGKHLTAGANKVVISAPAKGSITTVVLGVNEGIITGEETILSNASCTTNCLAPMVKVLDDAFGLQKGFITTIHAYTADQRLQDAPHSDLRRARAAALNMVPTSTGAAVAVGKVLPHLSGKLDGCAVRVPTPTGSITDLVAILNQDVTPEQVNNAMKEAAAGSLKGILEYTEEPLVSTDIAGNPHSCIFDSQLTSASGNLVKVFGWYDNEMGYATRLSELVLKVG